jgi:spore maturation protein CgeB
MRVLLVGPSLPFPWMAYTARALQRLGHAATPFRYTNRWVNRLNSAAVHRSLAPVPGAKALALASALRWRRRRDEALVALARRMRPELVLILRGELIGVEAIAALKRAAAGPMATWWVDDPDRYPGSPDRLRLYDHVFLFDRACARRLEQAGIGPVTFLPCACDETVFHPRPVTRRQRAQYGSEIALVAWCYPNRAAVVNALTGFDVRVWGRGWRTREARVLLDRAARGAVRGLGYVSDAQAALIYNATAIALNVHHSQSREAALNTRAFEVLATGAFELVDAVQGMEELLVPDDEVVTYRSPAEARERAAYYLRHPDARARIASRGHERVLAEHTYVHRMQTLLRTVGVDCAGARPVLVNA